MGRRKIPTKHGSSENSDETWVVGKFRRTNVRRYIPTPRIRRNIPRNPLRRNCPRNVLRRYIVFPMNSGLVCPHRNIVGSSSE
ncbi:hypothetical protein F2Q69_00055803 [Brassica cretica]|uniref:Uncharacterized protein n=1 Tax=Brassica cretica TaxID=69181 RepID=A0A8S9MVN1_BRACR|nr:hypothetical protein F2Q69_00055803 [Brassica cretica]